MKRDRRKRPFLENSTVCQKSTPDMLIPRPASQVGGSFEKSCRPLWRVGNNSEDAVNDRSYSDLVVPLSCCDPDYGKTFTESLILAQDERWRRA